MILTLIQSLEDDAQKEIVTEIYRRYYKIMYAIALKILKNEHDCQDAVQEAFLNITRTAEHFEDPTSSSTAALVSIYTRNTAINIYNHNKRFAEHFCSIDDMGDTGLSTGAEDDLLNTMIRLETAGLLRQAVEELEPMYRDVIALKYFHQYTNTDISIAMKLDVNTVNGRMFRAKKQLRKILEKIGYDRNNQ